MKKRLTISLSLAFAVALFTGEAPPLYAQGMMSVPSLDGDLSDAGLDGLADVGAQEVATIQRLLRRLGYLKTENMTRKMDGATTTAIAAHFRDVDAPPYGMSRSRSCAAVQGGLDQGGLGNGQCQWSKPCG